LNGSLLIDAENRCMLRRVQIQADDVSRLALEIRIVAGHVPLQTMRFHAGLFPDTMDSILADTQLYSQLAAAPVGGTVLRLSASGRKYPCPQLRSEDRGRLPGMAGIEPVHAGGEETLGPQDEGLTGGSQPALNGAER